jgi:hypothetical protein
MNFLRHKITLICISILLIGVMFLHLNSINWKGLFYFHGDSVTLALALKSILAGEPFKWVFSSQLFIFPEGILYAISYLVSQDYKSALLINAYINIGLIFLGAYYLVGYLRIKGGSAYNFFIILSCLFLISFSSESVPDINYKSISTLIMFNTYYGGVIIVSIFQLFLVLSITKSNPKYFWPKSSFFALCGALCYASDPLYLLQFLIPLIALLFLLLLLDRSRYFWLSTKIIFISAISLSLGHLLRYTLRDHWSASVGSYIGFSKVGIALHNLLGVIVGLQSSPIYLFLWALWACLLLLMGRRFCYLIRHRNSSQEWLMDYLVIGFLFSASILSSLGVILTGNFLTRYFLPVPIFSIIGGALAIIGFSNKLIIKLIIIILLMGSAGFSYFTYSNSMMTETTVESDIRCYQKFVNELKIHAVGGFWTSRALDLYGNENSRVFQVTKDFHPYNWLSNRNDYSRFELSGVIVDNEPGTININESDVLILGTPTETQNCQRFKIHAYAKGTLGFKTLNERMTQ